MKEPVARLDGVGLAFKRTRALVDVTLSLPAGLMVGVIGPDGVGKSSLFSLVAGARKGQTGRITVLGGDIADAAHRNAVQPRIAYMPQGLGRNLYPTLSVTENLDFFGRLFGQDAAERARRIAPLLESTGLASFADRQAQKLSGGMKQKLGLCCALIHDPDLLILDEPTTGVDPLSRRQFWELINSIRAARAGMSVIVSTAYMAEAARFDWLVAMEAGRVLATGTPAELMARTGTANLDAGFVALLPEEQREGYGALAIPTRVAVTDGPPAIEAEGLTKRFGEFTAVDNVSFRIERGEIFGFLGSNGCGKTTTMKMLTGLLPATEGTARLFGQQVDSHDMATRHRIGYMSQAFSLYTELTVRQNLELHARLFQMPEGEIPERVRAMIDRFGLVEVVDALPDALPLGIRQRLSLAVALIHGPDILILDEPTSGVDPVARAGFWQMLGELSRRDAVTIFVSTHFMNEAELCDRISLMHAGHVLVSDTPAAIVASKGAKDLETAFIAYLEQAIGETADATPATVAQPEAAEPPRRRAFDPRRMMAYTIREALELRRDAIRATLAVLGSLILMFVVGYGVNTDVRDLSFAVLDRDDTTASRDYVLDIAGSPYFVEAPPLTGYDDMDARMRAGEISLALEIPPGFARDIARGVPVEIGAWIDGAMPSRAETVRGYVQGMHSTWLARKAREAYGAAATTGNFNLVVRYRYNPGVESLVSMVPAVIPMLLLMIPAMLTVLSIVRETELGSIVNFYVTPVTRLEFLLGKQLPYVAISLLNFLLLTAFAVFFFRVPLTGSFPALALAAFLYAFVATAMGLFISTFMQSQTAAIFATALLTLIPSMQFSGVIDPVSSLQGPGAIVGRVFPATYFVTIARGTFSKGLGLADLRASYWPLALAIPVLLGLAAAFLRKQER